MFMQIYVAFKQKILLVFFKTPFSRLILNKIKPYLPALVIIKGTQYELRLAFIFLRESICGDSNFNRFRLKPIFTLTN